MGGKCDRVRLNFKKEELCKNIKNIFFVVVVKKLFESSKTIIFFVKHKLPLSNVFFEATFLIENNLQIKLYNSNSHLLICKKPTPEKLKNPPNFVKLTNPSFKI